MRSLGTGTFVKKYYLKQTFEVTPKGIVSFFFPYPEQANSLKGIDKKTGRREGISVCLLIYVLFLVTHFL